MNWNESNAPLQDLCGYEKCHLSWRREMGRLELIPAVPVVFLLSSQARPRLKHVNNPWLQFTHTHQKTKSFLFILLGWRPTVLPLWPACDVTSWWEWPGRLGLAPSGTRNVRGKQLARLGLIMLGKAAIWSQSKSWTVKTNAACAGAVTAQNHQGGGVFICWFWQWRRADLNTMKINLAATFTWLNYAESNCFDYTGSWTKEVSY